MGIEKRYKSDIYAKNEILKDQFCLMLKNKIKEMFIIKQNFQN